MDISNCTNLATLYSYSNNLVSLSLHNVDALAELYTQYTVQSKPQPHWSWWGGLGLHAIVNSGAKISLRHTHVMNLDEFVFRPLLETFTSAESSSGYVDMEYVNLDCGCDVKWIIEDFHFQTKYFLHAKCLDGTALADVS